VDKSDLTRLNRIEIVREMAGRQPLHHDAGGGSIIDAIRNEDERTDRNRNPLRIAARRIHPGDPLPRFEVADVFADRDNASGALDAENFRVGDLRPRHAAPDADIHEIDSGKGDVDEGIVRADDRLGTFDEAQGV
jgi:hypothetical protein